MSSDKVLKDGTTCLKDIHFDFLFMFLYKKASVMQRMLLVDKDCIFYDSNPWLYLIFLMTEFSKGFSDIFWNKMKASLQNLDQFYKINLILLKWLIW